MGPEEVVDPLGKIEEEEGLILVGKVLVHHIQHIASVHLNKYQYIQL